jgi:Xaa-Pro aminopeptidase
MSVTSASSAPLALAPNLQKLVDADVPRFSDAEMARRRDAIEKLMSERGLDHLILYGMNRTGSAMFWLTGWPTSAEALAILTPGRKDVVLIQYYNHVPLAERIAKRVEPRWGGVATVKTAIEELKARGARRGRVGVIGALGFAPYAELAGHFDKLVDLNGDYVKLRTIKSAEEVDWLRIGAAFSDRSIAALQREIRPGITERDLGDIVERAYVPLGGKTLIHFFGTTSMQNPDCSVPAQIPSNRRIAAGDVVFTEISGDFWEYPGQVLRTFAVGAEPTPLYRKLHDTADAVFDAIYDILRPGTMPAEVVEASGLVEASGFTICDDLMHGHGGAYMAPIVGSKSRPAGPIPDIPLRPGMTLVVQPNVITLDRKAGVQTGELLHITETGVERLHTAPKGFLRV